MRLVMAIAPEARARMAMSAIETMPAWADAPSYAAGVAACTRVDPVRLIEARRVGRRWHAPCPACGEPNTFAINDELGHFFCFGCGLKGALS